jgi:hypothetical protein
MPHFNSNHNGHTPKTLALFFLLLLQQLSMAQVFPVNTLLDNGNRPNRIILAYLADGYQASEQTTFNTNATTLNNGLFGQSPFNVYKNFFNCYSINVPSTQSGAVHPATASDEGSSGGQPAANPTNYFGSTFDYGSIHRLVVPVNGAALNSVLALNVADYDQAFIVVNSAYYGGSGGTFATSTTHPSAIEVAIHEIGHSFAGLADEYWAGDIYAAEKPNMTQNTNPLTVKWKNWYGLNSIGIFPYGASGNPSVWFRPHQNCKMQFLGVPFCSVCSERIVDRIHQLVNMADAFTPTTTSFTLTNTSPVSLGVTALQNTPSTITTNWYLNGSATPFATNQASVTIPFASLAFGTNTVKAQVVDNTTLSKSYLPAGGYVNEVVWTIQKPASLPVVISAFTGRVIDRANSEIHWKTGNANEVRYFELEKSNDGVNFNLLKRIDGVANRNDYSYVDTRFLAADNYYRLKITELNGTVQYSNILKLSNPFNKYYYKVYKDAAGRNAHLSCRLSNPEDIVVKVMNTEGQLISLKKFDAVQTQLEYDINLSVAAAGIYLVNIQIGSASFTEKIMVR